MMSFRTLLIVFSLLSMACNIQVSSPIQPLDTSEAERIGNEFMAHLVRHENDAAFGMMETELQKESSVAEMTSSLNKLDSECGHPVEYELRHRETGWKVYRNGDQRRTVKMYYSMATTVHPRGKCFFSVEVADNVGQLAVTSFGPLKLALGRLPKWAEEVQRN